MAWICSICGQTLWKCQQPEVDCWFICVYLSWSLSFHEEEAIEEAEEEVVEETEEKTVEEAEEEAVEEAVEEVVEETEEETVEEAEEEATCCIRRLENANQVDKGGQ